MSDDEVNKIIAEFMGVDFNEFSITQTQTSWIFQCKKTGSIIKALWLYTKSLDALVPVWEKLKVCDAYYFCCPTGVYYHINYGHKYRVKNGKICGKGSNLNIAAAHATAKAILELNND